jgi:hypothetical protein
MRSRDTCISRRGSLGPEVTGEHFKLAAFGLTVSVSIDIIKLTNNYVMCALQHTRITSPDETLCRSRVRLDLSTSLLQPSEYLLKLGAISLETTIVHKTREREAGNKGGMPAQAKYIYMPLKKSVR